MMVQGILRRAKVSNLPGAEDSLQIIRNKLRNSGGLVVAIVALLVVVAGCVSIIPIPPTLIEVSDGGIVFSPYNWRIQGANYAQSNTPGAYLKLGFTGTAIAGTFNTNAFDALGRPEAERPKIWVSIDNQSPSYYQPDGSGPLILASGLAAGNHTLELGFSAAQFTNDRWDGPANIIKVTGFRIDGGASTFLPNVRSFQMLLYGDSIGEGFLILEDMVGAPGTVTNSDAYRAFGRQVAEDLDAEFGNVAFSAQGYVRPGGGNVPSFPNTWDRIDSGTPRSFSPTPDLVVVGLGTNDGLPPNPVPNSTIEGAVRTWLEQARSDLPTSDIAVVIPFGGFARTAITDAVVDYLADFPGDTLVHLIDLGSEAQDIVVANSVDNIHPDVTGNQLLADLLSAALAPFVGP